MWEFYLFDFDFWKYFWYMPLLLVLGEGGISPSPLPVQANKKILLKGGANI